MLPSTVGNPNCWWQSENKDLYVYILQLDPWAKAIFALQEKSISWLLKKACHSISLFVSLIVYSIVLFAVFAVLAVGILLSRM